MSLLETSRALLSYAERLDNAELLGKIRDLQTDGLELFEEKLQLTSKLHNLEAEIATLKDKLSLVGDMVFVKGLYHILDNEGKIGQPYCPNCWETTRVAVHLHWGQIVRGYLCNNCSQQFRYYKRNIELTPDQIES